MTTEPLKNQIIDWAEKQKYWLQYSANMILESNKITDELIDTALQLFKEEFKLSEVKSDKKEIQFNKVTAALPDLADSLELSYISEIENVNALASNQVIDIGKNLTLIYGNNGSGKSGYVRLLNNAFNSRGDTTILHNVFAAKTDKPSCKFGFKSPVGDYTKEYPNHKDSFEFSQFSSFDSHSVKIHLDNDNHLNFTPDGFQFFDLILELYDVLKKRLEKEKSDKERYNPFLMHFLNENAVKKTIETLSFTTDEGLLQEEAAFSEQDEETLRGIEKTISELRLLDTKTLIISNKNSELSLNSLKSRIQHTLPYLSDSFIDDCNELITSHKELYKLSISEGIKNLEEYKISKNGSQQWRDFIIAAKKYSTLIKKNTHYPTAEDNCLFCLQPLEAGSIELINAYWSFLKSESERELHRVIQQIQKVIKDIKGLAPVKFDESQTLYSVVEKFNLDTARKLKDFSTRLESEKLKLLKSLENLEVDLSVKMVQFDIEDINKVIFSLKNEASSLLVLKPDNQIEVLENNKLLLNDRRTLKKILPEVIQYVHELKWMQKVEKSLSSLNSRSITNTQGELFSKNITDRYKSLFLEECEKLNAPKVVEIRQQNTKAKTLRKLQVATYNASNILSEGEQRAISLADFLTEIQINPNNRGVIFDDPVTSLDHERKHIIAKRMIELSKDKQVIIFTHDLLFVNYLKNFAQSTGITIIGHWIEKKVDVSGVISRNNNPTTEGDYKTTSKAEEALRQAKSVDLSLRESYLKDGFAALRTNYEYLVIFNLLQSVVLRFDERISIERLKDVIVIPEITSKIIEKVGLLSRYIEAHLHSDSYVAIKPTCDTLKQELDDFYSIKNEIVELRKKRI